MQQISKKHPLDLRQSYTLMPGSPSMAEASGAAAAAGAAETAGGRRAAPAPRQRAVWDKRRVAMTGGGAWVQAL